MQLRMVFPAAVLAVAAILVAPGQASATPADGRGPLLPLTDLAAERVLISDKVAAAKFPDRPISDPVREQQVLDAAAARATELGVDPAAAVRFFRAQIEASKTVQYGLFAYWTAHPDRAPITRPDLPSEVRPVIDRINAGLLTELAHTEATRASRGCAFRLPVAVLLTEVRRHLDRLHHEALDRAMSATCAGGSTA